MALVKILFDFFLGFVKEPRLEALNDLIASLAAERAMGGGCIQSLEHVYLKVLEGELHELGTELIFDDDLLVFHDIGEGGENLEDAAPVLLGFFGEGLSKDGEEVRVGLVREGLPRIVSCR